MWRFSEMGVPPFFIQVISPFFRSHLVLKPVVFWWSPIWRNTHCIDPSPAGCRFLLLKPSPSPALGCAFLWPRHRSFGVSGIRGQGIIYNSRPVIQFSCFLIFFQVSKRPNGPVLGSFLSPFILWFPTLLNRTSSVMIPLFCSVADWNFTVNFKFRSVLDPGALLQPVNPEFVWVCCIKFCSEKNRRQAWIKARTPYWNKPSSSKLMHGSSFIFFQDFDGFGVQKSPMIHYPCAVPPSL